LNHQAALSWISKPLKTICIMIKLRCIQLGLLASSFFICTAFMCSKDDSPATPNNPEFMSLIGYWTIKGGHSYGINDKGEKKQTATLKEGTSAYEFFADGTFISHVLVGQVSSEKGNWKLEVKKLDGKDIEEGVLLLTSPTIKAMAGELFVDNDGFMRAQITSINKSVATTKPRIYLTSKHVEAYPYKEAWVESNYEKR
jgi:hypothetical protein